MNTSQKRPAADMWQSLENMAEDDAAEREMDRVMALKPEEVDRELAAAGIDPAAVRARGEALNRQAALLAPPAPARSRRLSGRAVVLLLAAAVGVAVVVAWSQQHETGAHAPSEEAP